MFSKIVCLPGRRFNDDVTHTGLLCVVTLVESSSAPCGLQLVSSYQTNRVGNPTDLVELATQVQKV